MITYFGKKDVGHRSIVDKSSACGAKGPGFHTQWRKKIYLCHCVLICSVKMIVINNRARIGANLKKKEKKRDVKEIGINSALRTDTETVVDHAKL